MASLTGELLLYATGIDAALKPGPVKITQAVLHKADAQRVQREMARRLRTFFRGKDFAEIVERPSFDYDAMIDQLPYMNDEARQVENVSGFGSQDLAMEYADALGAALGYLQRTIPKLPVSAWVGGQRIQPADSELALFRRQHNVLERPLIVLDDLASGWLVDDQVETFAEVFPGLYAMARGLTSGLFIDAMGERKGWMLPYDKDLQLQVFLRTSTVDAALREDLLRRWEEKREEESGQSKSSLSAPRRKGVGDPSTQQERLEAK